LNIYKPVLLVVTCLLSQNITAQKAEVIDSLWHQYKTSLNDSIKLKAGNYLAFHYIFRTPERADSILSLERLYAKTNKLHFNLTELTNTRGIYYDVLGQKDSSKVYFKRALILSRKFQYPTIEVMCINNLGMFCWNNGQFKEAIDYFYQALEFSQEHNPENDKGQSIYLNNIGLIYQELKQFEKAIEYHNKALSIRKKYDRTKDIAASYNNLAICHKSLNKLEDAEKYINLAIDYAQEADQPRMVYQFYDTFGNILKLQNKYKQAEDAYLYALQIPDDYQGKVRGRFVTLSNIIDIYNTTNQYDKAQAAIAEADELIQKDSTLFNFSESFYINAAKTFFAIQQTEKANTYFKNYENVKDSLFSKENAQALADVETKLKTKEKEAELAQTKAELLEKELKVRQQNLIIYGSISLLVILIVLGYFIIKSKQLKNQKLQQQAELKTALAKIELKNKLEEQRLRISRDLHDNIGSQLTFVISSLQTLQYKKSKPAEIQSKLKKINLFTQQTINELRDTIWAMNKEEIPLSDLIDRLNNFISRLDIREHLSLSMSDALKSEGSTIIFSALNGIQIYRIIQESVNNAIKHAEAKNININFDYNSQHLEVKIHDDGRGFDLDQTKFGNGLNNMKKRAKRLNAELAIQSESEKGTTVTLTLNPKNNEQNI